MVGGAFIPPGKLRKLIHEMKTMIAPGAPFGVDLLLPSTSASARATNYDYTKGAVRAPVRAPVAAATLTRPHLLFPSSLLHPLIRTRTRTHTHTHTYTSSNTKTRMHPHKNPLTQTHAVNYAHACSHTRPFPTCLRRWKWWSPLSSTQLAELIDVVVEEGARLFVTAVGVPPVWVVEKLHSHGILVMNMVGSPKHVPKALAVGVDAVCAQGQCNHNP